MYKFRKYAIYGSLLRVISDVARYSEGLGKQAL